MSDPAVDRYLREGFQGQVQALGEVLDIEAGLAEVLNASAGDDKEGPRP